MKNPIDKLRLGLRNAHLEAQRRTDEAGLRDDLDDVPVFDRSKRRKKHRSLAQDARDFREDWDIDN